MKNRKYYEAYEICLKLANTKDNIPEQALVFRNKYLRDAENNLKLAIENKGTTYFFLVNSIF